MPIFGNCKDPSLSALAKVGYSVVQLPRVDLLPTQLLVAGGKSLQRLGDLTSVFVPNIAGAPVPPIMPDQPGPDIGGTKSSDLTVGIGLDILGGLVSALGGSKLGIDLAYSKAASVQFEFTSTKRCDTQLALIDQFLTSSTINQYSRAARQMLEEDRVYVVTSVIKSDTINVTAKDSNKQSLGIDIPVIQNAIGANISVGSSGAGSNVVTYKGAVPLVFGFQAARLIFDGERYRTMKLVEAGGVVAEGAGSSPVMLEVGEMLAG